MDGAKYIGLDVHHTRVDPGMVICFVGCAAKTESGARKGMLN